MSVTERCMHITTQHFNAVWAPCDSAEMFGVLRLSNLILFKGNANFYD